jgi:hypothetical protein
MAGRKPDLLVLSPGPCSPGRSGHLHGGHPPLRRQAAPPGRVPGPPGIGAAFGGKIIRAQQLMHGKTSVITPRPARRVPRGCRRSSPSTVTTRWPLIARMPADELIITATRRRRDHGGTPPRPAAPGRAIPPRVHPDRAWARDAEELPGASMRPPSLSLRVPLPPEGAVAPWGGPAERRMTPWICARHCPQPTPAMRAAMAAAELGDDVFADDPSVNALQTKIAAMLGFEAALFVPTGTQSNLCAILMAHCQRGDEYLVGQMAHSYRWEGGGAAVFGSVQPQPLNACADGSLPAGRYRGGNIKPDDAHFAKTASCWRWRTRWGGKLHPASATCKRPRRWPGAKAWPRTWTARACSTRRWPGRAAGGHDRSQAHRPL